MTDPNNIPQEAQQLKEELNAPQEKAGRSEDSDSQPEMASTDFDKEYEIAQQNENGSGTQSSDPNPVNRKDAIAGGKSDSSAGSGTVDNVNSPGDSDPNDYLDMAKKVTKNVEASKV